MQKQKLQNIRSLLDELNPKNQKEELWLDTTKIEVENFLTGKKDVENSFHISTISQSFFTDANLYSARPFISTGFKKLDELITGLFKGEMIVFGGRPGMGKTTFAINLMVNISRQNIPCLYLTYDTEMKVLSSKLMSCLSSIDTLNFREDIDSEKEIDKLFDAKAELEKLPIYLFPPTTERFPDFLAKLKSSLINNKIQVLFIDTLQLLTSHHLKGSQNATINFVLEKLKQITTELGIITILFSQLNRNVENRGGEKKPLLMDLRSSGTIEELADKIIFIYRAEYYGLEEDFEGNTTKNIMDLLVAKNKHGSLGETRVRFLGKYSKILEDLDLSENFGFGPSSFGFDDIDDDNY